VFFFFAFMLIAVPSNRLCGWFEALSCAALSADGAFVPESTCGLGLFMLGGSKFTFHKGWPFR